MPDPSLAGAIDSYRLDLDRLDSDARRRLTATFRSGMGKMVDELEALQAKIRTAPRIPIITGTGQQTTGIAPSWIFQEQRYLSLQAQTRAMIDNVTGELVDSTIAGRSSAYRQGVADARTAVATFIPEFDPGAWASVPRNAVASFLGASSAGPLAALFSSFRTTAGGQAEDFIRGTIAGGLMQGRGLFRVANDLQSGLEGITLSRALTISRTETLRAYREGSLRSWQENPKLVRSWIWRAAVDNAARPPCAACMARHGTEWPVVATDDGPVPVAMPTHPNCRCVMVPQRRDFRGLRPSGPGSTIEPLGRNAFDRFPLDVQRRILGPTRLGMYQRGEVAFSDFASVRQSSVWGANRARVTPIRELRAVSSETRTLRRVAEDRIAGDLSAEPIISAQMQAIEAELASGHLAGYNFRLKTFESTARKVESEVAQSKIPITPGKAAADLKDTIRYTFEIPDEKYVAEALQVEAKLQAAGYQRVKWASTWEGGGASGYKGLNSAWIEPSSGRIFELQFHTPTSLRIKETISHPLYERQRLLLRSDPEWARLERQIRDAWDPVPIPPGAGRLALEGVTEAITAAPATGSAVEAALAPVRTTLARRASLHAKLDELLEAYRRKFAETEVNIQRSNQLLALEEEARLLRTAIRTGLQAEEATLSARLAAMEAERARGIAAALKKEYDALGRITTYSYEASRAQVFPNLSAEFIWNSHVSLIADYRAYLFRLEASVRSSLPLRERIRSFDSVAGASWKGTVRKQYHDAYDQFANVVEALEELLPGLRSRWTGYIEGSRNGGHMGFDGAFGLNKMYRIDYDSMRSASKILARRNLERDFVGVDFDLPVWDAALQVEAKRLFEERLTSQIKVMIHEGLHSLSPGAGAEYRIAAGFEEGVIESLTHVLEEAVRKRLGMAPEMKGYNSYLHYTKRLEEARAAIGMQPLEFYETLIRTPIGERAEKIGRWIDNAVAGHPERREEYMKIASSLRYLLGKVRTQ